MDLITLTIIFGAITLLFFLSVILTSITKIRLCAICVSVSITWIVLLLLFYFEYFSDITILAVLMGGSVVGFYYLVEKKTKEQLHFFRLPFLLTLTFIAYLLIETTLLLSPLLFLGALWLAFLLVFILRQNPKANIIVKKVIACCKNW